MSELLGEFLPQRVTEPSLPTEGGWSPELAIDKIRKKSNRIQRLKPAVEDIIMEFWIAHEMIVNKKVQGWTWGRFCEEAGYSDRTPINWFLKYGMSYTRSDRAAVARQIKPKKLGLNPDPAEEPEEKPTSNPPPAPKPELKETLKEINKAIESGEISAKDLEGTRKAINKRGADPERQEDVKKQIPTKSRIRKLNDKMNAIADEFQYLAEGNLEPERGDEVWIKAIKMKGPSFIWMFHKMGVDLNQVYSTLINPGKELGYESERKEREERNGEEGIIDITPR